MLQNIFDLSGKGNGSNPKFEKSISQEIDRDDRSKDELTGEDIASMENAENEIWRLRRHDPGRRPRW